MSHEDLPLPLTFRGNLLDRMMPCLRAGECCSLVGVSGVGKSNLVYFLERPDVQAHYWGDAQIWPIIIDTHGLVFGEQFPEYVVAELMIHRLIREAERRGLSSDLISNIDTLHTRLIAQPSAHLAMRYLERICARFCEGQAVKLIFVFDQFDDLWKDLEPRFFLNLRHLRDEFKYRLAYLVITREQLQRLRQRMGKDLSAVESFWELFTTHVYSLGMYDDRDALVMLERIAQRSGVDLSPELSATILQASGRHAGLLRAQFWAWRQSRAQQHDPDLLQVRAVADECAKIWADLPPDEQQLARRIAADLPLHQPGDQALDELRLKGLVVGEPPSLFSRVFAAYIRSQPDANVAGIVVDLRTRKILRDGQPLADNLSPLEFNLLVYLARHAGTVCSRDDIMYELYQERMYDANDERLDTLLRRLRETLGDNARSPRYLFTHRGVGVRLGQGRVLE